MDFRPELLAPLNGWKSLSPATKVLENADAVYFGLQSDFSMRARATNFAPADLFRLMQKIHDLGKKGYLTTNILIYAAELTELRKTLEHAHTCEVDAIIGHDPASLIIAKEIGIPFHVSTQANISNPISAAFYREMGAERLILARELSLAQIAEIISAVPISIECFVHGAMCTAVSGRCYLSAEILGNDERFSANRGKCVQPCRRMYTFQGEEGELVNYDPLAGMFFNAKDLCMIGHIPALVEAQIQSFKIEGRMRDPHYLTEVVSCYREALNAYFDGSYSASMVATWLQRLEKVFNRGFHTGFYFGPPSPAEIEIKTRGNVSPWRKQQIGRVVNYYPKVGAVECELYTGRIAIGDDLVFENAANFYHRQTVDSLQAEGTSILQTEEASKAGHITVGIAVLEKIPQNALIYKIYKTSPFADDEF